MEEIKVTCDYCKKDITSTGRYHLTLSSNFHIDDIFIGTAITRYPLVKGDHHFCHFDCLLSWTKER